ncbi:DUF397 domain-containing protein [Nocardia sp. NPDC051750]|uniref:DUF397 domain-containing protein n=1 Tax=Nocardia sp. NPDC051750 TaxID=3364325 RepID=UPI00378B8D6E
MKNDLSNAQWFKSSHSGSGGDCVEAAWLDTGLVGIRDSTNPIGPILMFTSAEWAAFTARMRKHPGPWTSH